MFHTASNVFFILLSVLFFNRYPFKCLFCVIATNRYFKNQLSRNPKAKTVKV